ncbi:MAG: hypothetical protein KDC37_06075, partial [Flavobacteriales bacterium]|nr:hypothetical protein [Flavobacteriales bacterium]
MQKILQYLLIFLAVAGVSVARGQERPPVKVTTVMGLPYTPFLADYYAVNSSNLQATVLFTDLTESSLQVYLSIKINSASVKLESKPTFRPTSPLTIYPGQAKVIKGSDLSVYFDFNNLNLTGIT